jgi:hypothetical protein
VESQPNLHDELIAQLYFHAKHDPKHEVNMKYESIAADYHFKEKSPSKDHPSSEGVLKLDWMYKHCSLLPSLVLLTTSFGTDWPAGEWIRRETTIIERITQLKHFMQQRDVKVILILMKFGHNTIDKDVIDERLNAIKRHCQLESKSFVTLSSKDLITGLKDSLKRLTKTVRDYSAGYYVSQGKRLRGMERLIRPSDYILITRMNFKVAFFYEFQLQESRALRNYKQCYASLIDLHKLAKQKPEMIMQIKAVAEIVNFKLCNIQLKSGSVKEASQQFRNHMKTFSGSTSQFSWHDHTWAANQYLIYVSLLTYFSINTNHTDADRSYYYHRAALCSQKRQEAFQSRQQRSNSVEELEALHTKYKNVTTKAPKFFGSAPQYVNNSSTKASKLTASAAAAPDAPPSSTDLWNISQHSQLLIEEQVNHTDEILALLQKSLKNINPLHKRRKAHIRVLIAKQLMSIGDYDMASAHLSPLIDFLHREQWSFCAIPVLRKKMLCAIYLGRPREYIPAALKLYKIAVLDDFFESEDRMQLHRDLMSIIQNTEKPTVEFLQGIRDKETVAAAAGADASYVTLPLRPEYGAAAINTHPPEYFLPDSYIVELGDLSNGLFQIDIIYDHNSIEVGHHVKTQIVMTSLFQDVIKFTEMSAHFTDDVITQKFIHVDDEEGSVVKEAGQSFSSTANVANACLEFHPNTKKVFSFDLFISENALHKNETNHICLERLLLTMSVPLPTQTSGEEIPSLDDDVEVMGERVEDEILDSLQIEGTLQLEMQAQQGGTDPNMLHEGAGDIPQDSLTLNSVMTLKLEDSCVITADDVNIDMEEESLEIDTGGQLMSQEMDEKPLNEFAESDSDGEVKEEEEEEEEEGGREEEEEYHGSDDEEDGPGVNNDDDLAPATTPSKPDVHSKEDNVDEEPSDVSIPVTNMQSSESLEEEYDDDDDEVDSNRMSTSRLGMVVPDLNKLDPLMPVVVDKEMQKCRSRSSSLTPSYAAELLSATTLPTTATPSATPSAPATATPAAVQTSHSQMSKSDLSARLKKEAITPPGAVLPTSIDEHHSRTQSLPPKLLQTTNQNNQAMRERGYREIFFNASALTKTFREARFSNFGTPSGVKETADFLHEQNAPKLLAVTPPISYLQMLSPVPSSDEPICILQGTIQRLNFVFSSGQHKMLTGKVFMKSDYHQLRNTSNTNDDSHFFWYPNTASFSPSAVMSGDVSSSQSLLDNIHFHPFTNRADDNQPLYPIMVPDQEQDCIFACPVFIKSDVQGEINLTLKVEYIPSIFLKNTISKEFHVKIRVLKPFGMNFNITSLSDPHCGSEKKQGTSNVLRGDMINMAASLDCVNSLASDVEVLVMTIMTKNATVFTDARTGESIDVPVFELSKNNSPIINGKAGESTDSVCDLLRNGVAHLPSTDQDKESTKNSSRVVKSYITQRKGESQTIILQKGEAYVGSADLQCLKLESAESNLGVKYNNMFSEANSSISASMGDIIVNWRINDPFFFRPVDLSSFQTVTGGHISASVGDSSSSSLMSWLLPLEKNVDVAIPDSTEDVAAVPPLNTLITHTRVCNMLFSVPKVQIINAPFSVKIDSPTVASFGEAFDVRLNIFNKLNTLERLVMVAELTGEFLMTGGTFQVIEIAPNAEIDIVLTLVPLAAGQIPLPHICVTCERSKSTVLEFGTYTIPRHVFVKPVSLVL